MEKIAVYAGTFDPITNGHVDVIERAAQLFDKVIVVIAVNSKKVCLFDLDERKDMAEESLNHLDNVEIDIHQGLIVDFAAEKKATALIRGIRAVSDFDYEFQISLMNRKLQPSITTLFLTPHENYTYLNSSIIRELARYDRQVDNFIPEYVAEKLKQKFKNK